MALLSGRRLSPMDANAIGKTTEGTRIIRKLRETYPILSEKVPGEEYKVYYMNPEYLKEWKNILLADL